MGRGFPNLITGLATFLIVLLTFPPLALTIAERPLTTTVTTTTYTTVTTTTTLTTSTTVTSRGTRTITSTDTITMQTTRTITTPTIRYITITSTLTRTFYTTLTTTTTTTQVNWDKEVALLENVKNRLETYEKYVFNIAYWENAKNVKEEELKEQVSKNIYQPFTKTAKEIIDILLSSSLWGVVISKVYGSITLAKDWFDAAENFLTLVEYIQYTSIYWTLKSFEGSVQELNAVLDNS